MPQAVTTETALKCSAAPTINDDLNADSLLKAIGESLAYLDRLPAESTSKFATHTATIKDMRESLSDFKQQLSQLGLNDSFFEYVKSNFDFYQSTADKVLFTGYYEPKIQASRKRSDNFSVPLYGKPNDLIKLNLSDFSNEPSFQGLSLRGRLVDDNQLVPYHTRKEIDFEQALRNRDLEIFWVEDLVEAFFLQIQGSGILKLEDGSTVHVNYADKNGHPYRAIGRLLVERGLLTLQEASMEGIKAYLSSNPEELEEILSHNPSYVFFREVEKGPIGSTGAVLTPNRSIATDTQLFPRGALAFITTEKPVFDENGQISRWQPFARFVLNQDTGGAIRGPGRVDLFTGSGPKAGQIAGAMRQPGSFYFLLKKQ